MESERRAHPRMHTVLFVGMLVLALVAMALSASTESGATGWWGGLLLAYAAVSIGWDWQRTRERGEPAARTLRLQLLHWGFVLAGLCVLLLFERTEILSREAASLSALLGLGVGCLLAGLHFDRSFLLLGFVLAVMTVALGFLEQYLVWIVVLPVLAGAVWVQTTVVRRRRSSDASGDAQA